MNTQILLAGDINNILINLTTASHANRRPLKLCHVNREQPTTFFPLGGTQLDQNA